MTFITSKLRMIIYRFGETCCMFLPLPPLFFLFSRVELNFFAIQISMEIDEKHLRISNKKFLHKGSLRIYPIVLSLPRLLQTNNKYSSLSVSHLRWQNPHSHSHQTATSSPYTPGNLHPRPTPSRESRTVISLKKEGSPYTKALKHQIE